MMNTNKQWKIIAYLLSCRFLEGGPFCFGVLYSLVALWHHLTTRVYNR